MRILVFFDLPTVNRDDRRAHALFRHFLLRDGYDMLQWSVYARIVNGEDDWAKHQTRLVANLPGKGAVRCMKISEKQYTNMHILLGGKTTQEQIVAIQQVLQF